MMTPAATPIGVPGYDSLCRVQRLDRDERLIQERLCERKKIVVAAGDGDELDSSACLNHSATGLAGPVAEGGDFLLLKKG